MKFSPEGLKVSQAQITKAVLALNRKIRRKGKISAFEIHTARDLNTGENLVLNDEQLHDSQVRKRMDENNRVKSEQKEIKVGDTVILKNKADKHNARDMFIVTSKLDDETKVQKLLHPLRPGSGKFMSKVYQTSSKRLKTIHRPKAMPDNDEESENTNEEELDHDPILQIQNPWNPIHKHFHDHTDDEDEDLENEVGDARNKINEYEQENGQEHVEILDDAQALHNDDETPPQVEHIWPPDNSTNNSQQSEGEDEAESEPEIYQQHTPQNHSVNGVPLPLLQEADVEAPLEEAFIMDHSGEEHPQVGHQDVEPEQGPSHQVEEEANPLHNRYELRAKERKLFRSAPVTQKMKPKQLAIKKNTGVRKSKRLAIVKTRKIIKAIAAKLNQNTSSDTESSTDKDIDLENKSHTETDEEETDGEGGSERYEGDNEEETGENRDEGNSHEVENYIFQLDGGITPDSLTSPSNSSQNSNGPEVNLFEALDLWTPGLINTHNKVIIHNLPRSRIISTSDGQLSQKSEQNHRPSMWRRQLMRLRSFLDRLYKK